MQTHTYKGKTVVETSYRYERASINWNYIARRGVKKEMDPSDPEVQKNTRKGRRGPRAGSMYGGKERQFVGVKKIMKNLPGPIRKVTRQTS